MPYSYASKKSYSSSRAKARRRTYAPRKATKSYIAKVARQVTREDKPTKEYRVNGGGTLNTLTPPGSSIIQKSLVEIGHGTLVDQRASNRIYVAGVKFKLSIMNEHATVPRYVRIMVVHTTNKDGDLLDLTGWTDLFQDTDRADYTPDGKAGDAVSPINTDIVRPLYDKVFKLAQDGHAESTLLFQKWLPVRQYVKFDDEGASTLLTSGQIRLIVLMCEPNNTLSSTVCRYNYLARVFFKDA